MKRLLLLLLLPGYLLAGNPIPREVSRTLRPHILREAEWALRQNPETVTSAFSTRSHGTRHDFFSEGDYWWPDPANPSGPYIQKDGMTNPDNFVAHRQLMIRFSRIAGALASAYRLTGDTRYVAPLYRHLKAWFADTATRMNPSLRYAQAIQGRATGRGIGVIDTIHLMEVAEAVRVTERAKGADPAVTAEVRRWFSAYLHWLTTHPYGLEERDAKNNHGTCWVMQVAAFARLTADTTLLAYCRNRFKTVLLPNQMATDGSFPLELKRTKPYGYSLFNLDAMAMICQILGDSLWQYQTADGKSIPQGIRYLAPFVADKSVWPLPPDVMYWKEWPVAHPFLLFGGLAARRPDWVRLWERLDHQPETEEVIRNLPIRHPILWLE
ncbi:alginate lyase family protein [Siphonobacter aquaeclarae]|uniref:Alginate lyase n=1 Tax=Siphonobacter aquaeclarae TaxID=563176 RepID=A0A1G9WEL5_9BACT|nr:alginate lyase family protein [Siphonobacter aquaeclarae]SDM82938.1 Alginate lyase [Siphonobacter aquaeclarae]